MNKKEEFFEELSKQLDFSIDEYVEVEDIEDYNELYEQLEDQVLKSQKCREEFSELRSEIESFLEDYEEESFCYCGEEIEVGEEYCSKECARHCENEIT